MRYARVLYCPECESRDRIEPVCAGCGTARVARDGRALHGMTDIGRGSPSQPWGRVARSAGLALLGFALLMVARQTGGFSVWGLAFVVLGLADAIDLAFDHFASRDHSRLRALRRYLKVPVMTVDEDLDELGEETRVVAVVGRVQSLDAEGPVARARRELVDRKGMLGAPRGPVDVQRYRARASRVGARYLVVDDSGAAVVDADAFLSFPVPVARPGEPGERVIVDGTPVASRRSRASGRGACGDSRSASRRSRGCVVRPRVRWQRAAAPRARHRGA